ncbi:MAG: hypothetical protein V7L25_34330 [Nostoc sp.]|uniref:hypothetical protein n=1 Tax=Nostoc sp. TaxID=1180 RepID=UPI002FF03E44
MNSEQLKHSKNQQKQTSTFSSIFEEGMFQPRPFVVQSKKDKEEQPEQGDLETSLMQAERYGHNLSKINSTSISDSQIVQPKLRMGNLPGSIPKPEVNPPKIQSPNTVNSDEVVQTARVGKSRTSTSPTTTQSGRISKPPQRLTTPSTTNRVNKRRVRRNTGINAQKRIPPKQLQALLDDLQKNPKQPYAHLQDPAKTGNLQFTAAQKKQMYAANLRKHGQLTCDLTGQQLMRPQKSKKGVKPSHYEAQIDHSLHPFSKGGTNSFSNALVLSRYVNRFKSNN